MIGFYEVVIYFALFSFFGWVCETVFCSILEKRFVKRGFLNGPVCPVYGFGGLIVVYLLAPFKDSLVLLFIVGMIATTLLEYITSYILEKLFNTRWWDYSDKFMNINGRVCLIFSLMFGALSLVGVKLIYPPFSNLVENSMSSKMKAITGWLVIVVFLLDLTITVYSILKINGRLAEIEIELENLKAKLEEKQKERIPLSQQWKDFAYNYKENQNIRLKESMEKLGAKLEKTSLGHRLSQYQIKRLNNAFPNMKSTKHQEQLMRLMDWINEKKDDKK